jgi:hypothetical protein
VSPIKSDRSATPRGGSGGNKPDANPRFVTAVAQAWHQEYLDEGKDKRAKAFDTPFRASNAGFCSMSLALGLLVEAGLGVESNPPTLSDLWRMNLGTMIHSTMEHYLPLAFPGAECEVVGKSVDGEVSFHADVLIKQPHPSAEEAKAGLEWRTLFELKSINGTGFKSSTIGYRKDSPAEGPRSSAVLQAALAAEAFDCDEVVVGYLSMENIGDGIAKTNGLDDIGKFAAEWTYTRDEYLPLAQAERARMKWIAATVDAGRLPTRSIPDLPDGAVITDPSTGSWSVVDGDEVLGDFKILDIGKTWQCGYCRHADSCIQLAKEGK